MTTRLPSSAAQSIVATPAREKTVAGMPRFGRRFLTGLGLLIGGVIPALVMLYDPYRFVVQCSAVEQVCVVGQSESRKQAVAGAPLQVPICRVVGVGVQFSAAGQSPSSRQFRVVVAEQLPNGLL